MPGYIYFFVAVAALIGGYALYSRIVEKCFGMDPARKTPAEAMADGVDYIKLPTAKAFLIQLLNIAGVGPVFGPIMGALYGPSALLWIVLGAIFAGGVHDYFSGMLSDRYLGKSTPDIVGNALGAPARWVMRFFSIVLLVLVGVVFVSAPAELLVTLTGVDKTWWVTIIFAYYFLATILPIDVIIGRIYPLFAVVLIIMAVGVSGGLLFGGYDFYNWAEWTNPHPKSLPIWPMLFITIACGALSGFHATQSPLMARCIGSERDGRAVFYGAMVAEGVIALIWATAGMTFYPSAQALMDAGTPSVVINTISVALLGTVGGVLAVLGVVVLPITSGDTAFRAARLTIADIFGYRQKLMASRLSISVPLFAIGVGLTFVDFDILWRYFGWANQTLATIVLWAAAAYLVRRESVHWMASVPATIMTAVVVTYICFERTMGFGLGYGASFWIGVAVAAAAFILFMSQKDQFRKKVPLEEPYPVES